MGSVKQLAQQTIWYGLSNVVGRLLTSLLTPYLTYIMVGQKGNEQFGEFSYIYLMFPVLNILFTYGMETAFFRFSSRLDVHFLKLFRTQMTMMLISTLFLCGLLIVFKNPAIQFAELSRAPQYFYWCLVIIALDTLTTLPFARLRKENKPRKYAFIRLAGIAVYVVSIISMFSFGNDIAQFLPFTNAFFSEHWGLGYILLANILQCLTYVILTFKEWKDYRWHLERDKVKPLLQYGIPILIAGFGGVINDTLNRVMYVKLYPDTISQININLGIFTATLRIAILIQLAIQAFKMAAEPFFFSIANKDEAKGSYATIMTWFVIIVSAMLLNILLFIDVWQYFIGPDYRSSLDLIPILLLSFLFLGIYYNLSIWYKLTDQTYFGALIMIIGAIITLAFNFYFIPKLNYAACAWSMLISNAVMMILSYMLGQKYYRVPYQMGKLFSLFGYIMMCIAIFYWVYPHITFMAARIGIAIIAFAGFLVLCYILQKAELGSLRHRVLQKIKR